VTVLNVPGGKRSVGKKKVVDSRLILVWRKREKKRKKKQEVFEPSGGEGEIEKKRIGTLTKTGLEEKKKKKSRFENSFETVATPKRQLAEGKKRGGRGAPRARLLKSGGGGRSESRGRRRRGVHMAGEIPKRRGRKGHPLLSPIYNGEREREKGGGSNSKGGTGNCS